MAVAEAGKHLWLEKPAGRERRGDRRDRGRGRTGRACRRRSGFNYRNAPAVELARRLVAEGRLGRVEQVTIRMLADYAAHPEGALTWRYQNQWAGSGVLGDLVSHGIDLGRYVVGEVDSLVCDTATFITERPALSGAAFAHTARGTGALAPVENEDYAGALLALRQRRPRHAGVQPRRRRRAVHVRHRGARRRRRRWPGTSGGWASCGSASTRR